MLQSAGGSATIAIGYGVVADIAAPAERGGYVGAALIGPNAAQSIGKNDRQDIKLSIDNSNRASTRWYINTVLRLEVDLLGARNQLWRLSTSDSLVLAGDITLHCW
jgi:hypothetical protein